MYISNGTSSAAGRSTNAKVAAGSMKRRINHADAMRSTPGRGRVTQRRFENVFADENAEAAKLAETQRRRGGDAEATPRRRGAAKRRAGSDQRRRAEGAAPRGDRHLAQALGALLGRRVRRRLAAP